MANIVKSVDSITEMILFYTIVENREFDVVVTDSQGDNRIFHYDAELTTENNGVNIFDGAYCPHNGVLNLRWGGATFDGVTDDSEKIQNVIDVLKTTNNLHSTLYGAISQSDQGGVFILDGKPCIKNPLYYHSSMKIIGNSFFNSAFIYNPDTHQHHMFGADIIASKIGKKSFINVQLENLAFINKKDNSIYSTSRLGYNPNTRHCVYFENTRLTSLNNVLFVGFINGTADSVGYVTNETIDSTDKTNINFRTGLHPDERSASTTFTDFTYRELFDTILQDAASTAGWAWNHKRDNVYYQNNHLSFWARNGGTTSSISGGSCELSSNWGTNR